MTNARDHRARPTATQVGVYARAAASRSCAARARASGTPTASSTSTSSPALAVTNLGHRHPRDRRARSATQARKLLHVSNLHYSEPQARLAELLVRALVRRPRLPLQQRRRGQRGGDQAGAHATAHDQRRRPLRDPHRRSARSTAARSRRSPRPAQEKVPRRLPAAAPGLPLRPLRRRRRARRGAVRRETVAILLEPIQGEGGVVVPRRELSARSCARSATEQRPAADLRRGPDRHGPHRHALRLRADRHRARHHDARQGARRRRADRRHADDARRSPPRFDAGRARLDLRRQRRSPAPPASPCSRRCCDDGVLAQLPRDGRATSASGLDALAARSCR